MNAPKILMTKVLLFAHHATINATLVNWTDLVLNVPPTEAPLPIAHVKITIMKPPLTTS